MTTRRIGVQSDRKRQRRLGWMAAIFTLLTVVNVVYLAVHPSAIGVVLVIVWGMTAIINGVQWELTRRDPDAKGLDRRA
jgi:uncharacterized membrane protein HdeD (DUF308 family)